MRTPRRRRRHMKLNSLFLPGRWWLGGVKLLHPSWHRRSELVKIGFTQTNQRQTDALEEPDIHIGILGVNWGLPDWEGWHGKLEYSPTRGLNSKSRSNKLTLIWLFSNPKSCAYCIERHLLNNHGNDCLWQVVVCNSASVLYHPVWSKANNAPCLFFSAANDPKGYEINENYAYEIFINISDFVLLLLLHFINDICLFCEDLAFLTY